MPGTPSPQPSGYQGKRIPMTAPVVQEELGKETFTVSCVMPAGETMDSLPQPNNPEVHLRKIPSRAVAVLRYRGAWGEHRRRQKERLLLGALRAAGIDTISSVRLARYNSAWTPPWMKRNEIHIDVRL